MTWTRDPFSTCRSRGFMRYKRQLMNILHVMYLYNQLKDNPDMDMIPRTFIFGAKGSRRL